MKHGYSKGWWFLGVIFLCAFLTTITACKGSSDLPENNAIHLLDGMKATIARNSGNCDQMADDLNQFWDRYYPNYKDAFFSMSDPSRELFRQTIRSIFIGNGELAGLETEEQMRDPSALRLVAMGIAEALDGAQTRGFRIRARGGGRSRGARSTSNPAPQRPMTVVFIGGHRYERGELTEKERIDYQGGLKKSGDAVIQELGSCRTHAKIIMFGERLGNDLVDPPVDGEN